MTSRDRSLPSLLQDYLNGDGFWNGPADFDFWYAVNVEEWFWLHYRRNQGMSLAVALFRDESGPVDIELFNLSRVPIQGLKATIANTPLIRCQRYEPPLPLVAVRLKDGRSHYFTLPREPSTVADEWLNDALARLQQYLHPPWLALQARWDVSRSTMLTLWPEWAGPPPPA